MMFTTRYRGTHKARKDRIAQVSEEMDLYSLPPQVCVTHMRHVPCRGSSEFKCVFSEDPEDVRIVSEFQRA